MNMSRASLRQILGAGLIHGVTAAALTPDAEPDVARVCARLDRLAEEATDFALRGVPRTPEGLYCLSERDWRKRQRAQDALIVEIGRQYAEEVDVRDFVSAALRWVEDLREQLPTAPADRRIVWSDIAGGLQALYDLYDPEGRAYDAIDAGADRGGDFQRCTGVW